MKMIVFGDMTTGAARRIPGLAEADLAGRNGDLTNRGGVRAVKAVPGDILSLNPNLPLSGRTTASPATSTRPRDTLADTSTGNPDPLRLGHRPFQ